MTVHVHPFIAAARGRQLKLKSIAERIRKTGGSTLRSIGHVARIQRIKDINAEYVDPLDMLAELRSEKQTLAARL
jgi:starvation-inducible DNA-binding protein